MSRALYDNVCWSSRYTLPRAVLPCHVRVEALSILSIDAVINYQVFNVRSRLYGQHPEKTLPIKTLTTQECTSCARSMDSLVH